MLTTDVFASFGAFAEREDLPHDAIARAFRDDPELRELMLGLEAGDGYRGAVRARGSPRGSASTDRT